MDVLLRTLTRRNTSPPPRDGGGGRGRNRTRRDDGGGHSRQFELILEMLAKGLVEYAVRKYMPGQGGERDRGSHDDRVRTRGRDEEERHRGGVPNMDADALETIGKSILAKAMEKFGGGAEEERGGERSGGGGGASGSGRERTRGGSLDRYANSRALSREDRGHGENGGQRRRGQSEHGGRGSPDREPRHRDEQQQQRRHRRQGHGWTDYGPLKTELEALSNAIISLNERQPGHADCEFYDAFTERSGNVQEKIGALMVRIREREERREERRGRRRS